MREERGAIAGPLVVHEPYTLWGTCGGTITVVEGGKFYMRGSLYGDLNVEFGGRVHVYGNITGNLKVARVAKVILSGTVAGDAVNEGGRLYVDATGEVRGKTRTIKGETRVEPKPLAEGSPRDGDDAERSGRLELSGSLTAPSAELAAEAERLSGLLKGRALARVWQHRPEAMGIEFADGTKLYVSIGDDGLEINVSGKLSAAPPPITPPGPATTTGGR
jgi:hypothetical protein